MLNIPNDKALSDAINKEAIRQEEHIELIASENYADAMTIKLAGSILTNKYAEGYPGKRYYGGCEYVDQVENLAIERAKLLFDAAYANVQPHSGSQANAAVFHAFLEPGDKVLAMSLNHGGHLTHGSKVNFSGKTYNFSHYGVNDDGFIDYDALEVLAKEFMPKLIIAGFSAYPRNLDFDKFKQIAKKVNALLLVDMAHISGLVAAKLIPNPVKYADFVTSTTHKTLRGPRSGIILSDNLDYAKKLNSGIFPGVQGGPLMHIIACKAYCFLQALQPSFQEYQKKVLENAKFMANALIQKGFKLVSNGTDNHLLLIDLNNFNLSGKQAEALLESANITVNKNQIPKDTRSPFITSGIRIGTPAITTRGFGQDEIAKLSNWMYLVLKYQDVDTVAKVKEEVLALCKEFPVYKK